MFDLASHLKMTVSTMLQNIDSRELSEWIAYYSIEPFGEQRADLRSASICTLIHNTNYKKPTDIKTYMPDFSKSKTEKSPDQIMAILKALTEANNRKIK